MFVNEISNKYRIINFSIAIFLIILEIIFISFLILKIIELKAYTKDIELLKKHNLMCLDMNAKNNTNVKSKNRKSKILLIYYIKN